ncbi:MAG: ribonuclease Z [Proteobacteria bacterium]|nr:ribonuclease Z [Pseudomonadota bacterium]
MQLLHPHLLNQPFGDPALYVELKGERSALLFDLGDIATLRAGKILKISRVFVSHMHMDHFIGFDHLLRLFLARDATLRVYGPQGIINTIKGKLKGYTWNLVSGYPFILEVAEILKHSMRRVSFVCRDGFKPTPVETVPFNGMVADKNLHYTVNALHLDHKITSLAFAIEERFHININKDRLNKLGLPVGPWLRELKDCLWEGKPDTFKVKISAHDKPGQEVSRLPLGKLKREIVSITQGQKIVYVSDCRGTEDNLRKIIRFAMNADILFCEGSFLSQDRAKAEERGHLTAEQAGFIARQARVKVLQIYHFSPRYENCPEALYQEAERAFKGKSVTR